ncbi:phosphatase PAP2 family protein [Ammoniphilus resinae]|uniref:Undecaprenyl-diphosphatase n=1 Tax=Ammoniphilus resinae TaxID=861532 RepID=A0ABS4GJ41_9BACL|nr:phosphatase PAP2 family protein [Ammoniphilus resinae]MBP1930244.1 undecaprenyl-diphosphatase [Ammoniphilus resinae]
MNAIMDSLMIGLSQAGNNGMIWIFICLIMLLKKTWRKAGVYLLITIALGAIAQDVLKDFIQRPRPVLDPAELLIPIPTSYSFPSGHTLISFAAAATISAFFLRAGVIFFVFALLIGGSRVYLGVHYVSDVIGGALFGMTISYIVLHLPKWVKQQKRNPNREM